MVLIKCFKCGRINSLSNNFCLGCGEKLSRGPEYEQKIQELKDYQELRKKYGMLGIILLILMLLILYPVVRWLFQTIFSAHGTESLPDAILQYATPVVVVLVFLAVVLPLIIGRWRILRKYHWTRERMQSLDLEAQSLPQDLFGAAAPKNVAAQTPVRKVHGPPVALLVILLALAGLVFLNEYTDFRPLSFITSFVGIGNAQKVEGQYDAHVEAADLGGGVKRVEQTWSMVFRSNGTYTSYLESYQQFSGTWSQSSNILTVNVPEITNISAAYSFQATVSRDGKSFTSGDRKFIRIK